MRGTAILRRPGSVGSRPHQRMAEPHLGADLEQLLRRGHGRCVAVRRPEPAPARHRSVASPVGSAAASSISRRVALRQGPHAPQVVVVQIDRTGCAGRDGEAARQLDGVHPAGSSSSANGLPPVSATIRSRTRSSR